MMVRQSCSFAQIALVLLVFSVIIDFSLTDYNGGSYSNSGILTSDRYRILPKTNTLSAASPNDQTNSVYGDYRFNSYPNNERTIAPPQQSWHPAINPRGSSSNGNSNWHPGVNPYPNPTKRPVEEDPFDNGHHPLWAKATARHGVYSKDDHIGGA